MYEGQPQPSSTSGQYFGRGSGTTQSTSMPQGGFDNVSYASDPNLSSQPSISFSQVTPQYQLQASDSMAAAQDSAVNAMAGLSEEEMLATLRAIGNPGWWSNMMMPGYVDLISAVILSLITYVRADSPGRVQLRPALQKVVGRSLSSPSHRVPLCQVPPGSAGDLRCILPLNLPPFHFTRVTPSLPLYLGRHIAIITLRFM